MTQIELDQVAFSYPSGFGLKDFNLKVRQGSILGILGPNGSGKSTLLQLISRLLRPTRGTVRLEGKDVSSFSAREFAQRVSVIPSENFFEFPFTVAEVVEMGRYPYLGRLQSPGSEDRQWIERARRLTEIGPFWQRSISELSSGERQRVLIARALAQNPAILLLDEPSTHMDINHQVTMFRMLKTFHREQGATILVVLHDLTLADAFCEEVALLKEGRLVQWGAPREVITGETLRDIFEADVQFHRRADGSASLSFDLDNSGKPPGHLEESGCGNVQ